MKLLKIIKKEFLAQFKKTFFWNIEALSHQHCMHVFGEKSERFGDVCNKKIEIKDKNNYYCSDHIGLKHEKNIKKREVPDELRCIFIKNNGGRCKLYLKKNKFCDYHYSKEIVEQKEEEERIIKNKQNLDNLEMIYLDTEKHCYKLYIDYLNNLYTDYYNSIKEEEDKKNIYLNNDKILYKNYYINLDIEKKNIQEETISNVSDMVDNIKKEIHHFNDKIILNNNKFKSIKTYINQLKNRSKKMDKIYDIYDIYKDDYININNPIDLFEKVCEIQNSLYIFLDNYKFENLDHLKTFITKYKNNEEYICLIGDCFNVVDHNINSNLCFLHNDNMDNKFILKEENKKQKEIDIEKFKNYYKKIKDIEKYIKCNKYIYNRYINNKNKYIYYKENDIKNLLEEIQLLYDELYDSLPDKYYRDFVNVFKQQVDQSIIDFYNIDDRYKLYL
jgi:hypothetical protein